jgi:hypothetical protein
MALPTYGAHFGPLRNRERLQNGSGNDLLASSRKGLRESGIKCFISKIRKEEDNELEKHFTV